MSLLLSYLETIDSYRTVKTFGDQSIGGDKIFTGNTIFQGSTTFAGSPTIINTVDLAVEDNLMILNYGEAGSGVTAGSSGLQIDRGLLAAYQIIFQESDDTFRVGQIGSTQAVATRQDSPSSAGVPYWNSTSSRYDNDGYLSWNTTTKQLVAAGGSNSTVLDGTNGAINLCNVDSVAAINFKNLSIDDADARIIQDSNGLKI